MHSQVFAGTVDSPGMDYNAPWHGGFQLELSL